MLNIGEPNIGPYVLRIWNSPGKPPLPTQTRLKAASDKLLFRTIKKFYDANGVEIHHPPAGGKKKTKKAKYPARG
jgi:hypothetical protein